MTSGLKFRSTVYRELGVLLGGGGLLIWGMGHIFQGSRGFVPGAAYGFGWSIFTNLCVRYNSDALADARLMNGGRRLKLFGGS